MHLATTSPPLNLGEAGRGYNQCPGFPYIPGIALLPTLSTVSTSLPKYRERNVKK